MALTLYDTASRTKQVFEPLDPSKVRMYLCGPTVYGRAHIGNARAMLVFDLMFRVLREIYGPDHVIYARNLTDVDDKINARAREEGVDIDVITERTISEFHADMAGLNALPPTIEPRATHHIDEMIAMITSLIDAGHAYAAEGHVLFHVPSHDGYGALSGRSTEEMQAGARVEVAPYKRDPMDFVLWKPSAPEEPGWDSPWGRGRPGWHIECSAMTEAHLGKTFDIHGGGLDLVFPHHENEMAQSTCAHGGEKFAQIWMHNGMLQLEGRKMSKSEGNFLTIDDALKDWPGEVLRLQMFMTHYHQPINWTTAQTREAKAILDKWYELVDGAEATADMPESVMAALDDDLNTPLAINAMHALADRARKGDTEAAGGLLRAMGLLGLRPMTAQAWRDLSREVKGVDASEIEGLIGERREARAAKNFARADQIRDALLARGIVLKDGPEGTTWSVAP